MALRWQNDPGARAAGPGGGRRPLRSSHVPLEDRNCRRLASWSTTESLEAPWVCRATAYPVRLGRWQANRRSLRQECDVVEAAFFREWTSTFRSIANASCCAVAIA